MTSTIVQSRLMRAPVPDWPGLMDLLQLSSPSGTRRPLIDAGSGAAGN